MSHSRDNTAEESHKIRPFQSTLCFRPYPYLHLAGKQKDTQFNVQGAHTSWLSFLHSGCSRGKQPTPVAYLKPLRSQAHQALGDTERGHHRVKVSSSQKQPRSIHRRGLCAHGGTWQRPSKSGASRLAPPPRKASRERNPWPVLVGTVSLWTVFVHQHSLRRGKICPLFQISISWLGTVALIFSIH